MLRRLTMKTNMYVLICALLASALSTVPIAKAQQAATPTTFAELSKPTTEANPHPEYVRALARQAYLWGWPMVNMINRHNSTTQATKPGPVRRHLARRTGGPSRDAARLHRA